MRVRVLLTFMTAAPIVAANIGIGHFCSRVKSAVNLNSEQAAAAAYCASYLELGTRTTTGAHTATKTVTKVVTTYVSTTTKTVTRGSTLTKTVNSYTIASTSATTTLYTSTSTVYSALTDCPSPTSTQKLPSALHAMPPASLSVACKCLPVKTPIKTLAKSTITTTVTKTATRVAQKTVHPQTTTTGTVTLGVETSYSTVRHYTTTTTVTATSPFKLLDSSSNKWAAFSGYTNGIGGVHFNADEESATEFGYQPKNSLLYNGQISAFASSFSSGAYIVFDEDRYIGASLTCQIDRNPDGYCTLGCSWSGGGNQNEVDVYGRWYVGGIKQFDVYAVGVTT